MGGAPVARAENTVKLTSIGTSLRPVSVSALLCSALRIAAIASSARPVRHGATRYAPSQRSILGFARISRARFKPSERNVRKHRIGRRIDARCFAQHRLYIRMRHQGRAHRRRQRLICAQSRSSSQFR